MEDNPSYPSLNRMIIRAITASRQGEQFCNNEQEALKKAADQLLFAWLMHASKKAGKTSMDCLVQMAQKATVLMLNQLSNRPVHEPLPNDDCIYLERRLIAFLLYLQKHHPLCFDFKAPMPVQLWVLLKNRICEAVLPGEKCCMLYIDEPLVRLLQEQLVKLARQKRPPAFVQAYYWKLLIKALNIKHPPGEATAQAIHALVGCNFNSEAFVAYVIGYYGKTLNPADDAAAYWKLRCIYLRNIPEHKDMILYPGLTDCKTMLFARIENLVQAYLYNRRSVKPESPVTIRTKMPAAELALYLRLEADTRMLDEVNDAELMKKIAQLYETPQGMVSYKYLRNKYYQWAPSTIENLHTRLSKMINRLNELAKKTSKKQ